MAVRLILVRHGESEWNVAQRFQGHGDSVLTARGREQAKVTAELLVRSEHDVVLLARSDLGRVAETAAPSEQRFDVPVVVEQRLREIDVGTWTGLHHDEIARLDPDGWASWSRGEDRPRGGGETFVQLGERMRAALLDLAGRAGQGSVLVFTHGGAIRVATAAALGLPPEGQAWLRNAGNCSLTVLSAADDRLRLVSYNSTAHLLEPVRERSAGGATAGGERVRERSAGGATAGGERVREQ